MKKEHVKATCKPLCIWNFPPSNYINDLFSGKSMVGFDEISFLGGRFQGRFSRDKLGYSFQGPGYFFPWSPHLSRGWWSQRRIQNQDDQTSVRWIQSVQWLGIPTRGDNRAAYFGYTPELRMRVGNKDTIFIMITYLKWNNLGSDCYWVGGGEPNVYHIDLYYAMTHELFLWIQLGWKDVPNYPNWSKGWESSMNLLLGE